MKKYRVREEEGRQRMAVAGALSIEMRCISS
jgi:hypothetical protein